MNLLQQDKVETKDFVFKLLAQHDYEKIVFCQDNNTGLKAIIAIHNTVLGPGLGGTRMYNYKNENDAIVDVLRLARGMTYKAAISGLNLGGAKAVIIGDPRKHKSEGLMRKFGRFVENLNGKYITAEDVGTTTKDMEYIHMETDNVVGLPEIMGGGGDPSPVTAYGTYYGMKASAKVAYGNDSLAGKKVMVEGIGKVGHYLVSLLAKENAKIYISDINEEALAKTSKEFGATVIDVDKVYDTEVDIYAPCALGATVNDDTLPRLKCNIIAGAANNQLEDENKHGEMLKERDILYAPDFLINAGGLINVYTELHGYNREIAMAATEKIYETTLEIYKTAAAENIPTYKAANLLAEKRIKAIGDLGMTY
jgi:leucine dehydrogenase